MIKRIRLEAQGPDKDQVAEEIARRAVQFFKLLDYPSEIGWECTQDVVSGWPGNYQGRMVFIYRG